MTGNKKTVLITGANKGIGLEVAKQLAEHNYFVYIGSRILANGIEAQNKFKTHGLSNVAAIEIDVTDYSSIQQAINYLLNNDVVLDVLINNAGIAGQQPQTFSGNDLKTLREIMETNFFGSVQTTQLALPLLRKSTGASIINVSSEMGSLAIHAAPEVNPNRAKYHMYGASKTALNVFTIMLANELRSEKIRVNSVTPGYTATNLNGYQGLKTIPQGAKAIVDLALSDDRSVTGQFLQENGKVEW
jgi:NAD(P)-dependent dehydrogenase (short-subunit alcohol dehydrogenase family)